MTQITKAPAQPSKAKRLIVALLALSAIPFVAGIYRLVTLAGGAEITPDNARFFESPIPVVVHILSVSVFAVLGPFQFSSGFRRRRPGWHRAAGRILVLCGLVAGLSGLWMTLFYPRQPGTGELLYVLRLLFGTAMVAAILLGLSAIRQRGVKGHRAWMIRGYAIGLGAGTQAFTQMAWIVIAGPTTELSGALMMGAGWAINVAVAEWAIRRRLTTRRSRDESDNL